MARMKRKKIVEEVPEVPDADYRDTPCIRCDAVHYNVLDFVFAGEWRLEAMVCLLGTHPEYIQWLKGHYWAN